MTHPILALQGALVAALREDAELAALAPIFDAPPKAAAPPYVTIARHDLLPRDGDETPGNEHRLIFHAWAADASRKAVADIDDAIVGVACLNVLEKAMVTDPGEKYSITFHGGAGLEYQLENRHYAVGIGVDGFLVPQFATMKAIDSRLYLRYTYGGG